MPDLNAEASEAFDSHQKRTRREQVLSALENASPEQVAQIPEEVRAQLHSAGVLPYYAPGGGPKGEGAELPSPPTSAVLPTNELTRQRKMEGITGKRPQNVGGVEGPNDRRMKESVPPVEQVEKDVDAAISHRIPYRDAPLASVGYPVVVPRSNDLAHPAKGIRRFARDREGNLVETSTKAELGTAYNDFRSRDTESMDGLDWTEKIQYSDWFKKLFTPYKMRRSDPGFSPD